MLTVKTLMGVGWSVCTRLANRLIDFATLLILARVLSPADFGLTALASTLVVIVETVLEIALVQVLTRLPQIDKSHLDTAFTLGLLRGLALAVIVMAAAFPFAALYHDDRLVLLVTALAIAPVARGVCSPAMVKFFRQLSFREMFVTQILAKVVAALTAFGILVLGGGYWAIAANSIVASLATAAFTYIAAPYRPALSLTHVREFTGFLGWFSVSQLVSAINWQLDRFLLGSFVSRSDLGKYTMSADLAALPTQSLIGPAMQPVMAAFARISSDPVRLRNAYLKATRFTMMLAMPACILLSLTANWVIEILLDPQWKDAAVYLQWLALTVLLNAYFQPLYSAALAINRPKAIFDLNAIDLAMRIVLVPAGIYFFSIWGAIAARGFISVIMFFASVVYARKLLGTSLWTQLHNLWEISAACSAMAAAMMLLEKYLDGMDLNAFVELATVGAFGVAAYLTTLYAFGIRLAALTGVRR